MSVVSGALVHGCHVKERPKYNNSVMLDVKTCTISLGPYSPEYPESFSEPQQEPRPLELASSAALCIASRVVLLHLSLAFLLDEAQRLCLLKQG